MGVLLPPGHTRFILWMSSLRSVALHREKEEEIQEVSCTCQSMGRALRAVLSQASGLVHADFGLALSEECLALHQGLRKVPLLPKLKG